VKAGFSRMKYKDLGNNPETGAERKQYAGYMDDEEYVGLILKLNGAVDDPTDVAGLPDLDADLTADERAELVQWEEGL